MTKDELIAKQQIEIEELNEENQSFRKARGRALGHIYCIGGPLNDNKLGYSKAQMVTFARIAEELNQA
jgi:hypothetical protein